MVDSPNEVSFPISSVPYQGKAGKLGSRPHDLLLIRSEIFLYISTLKPMYSLSHHELHKPEMPVMHNSRSQRIDSDAYLLPRCTKLVNVNLSIKLEDILRNVLPRRHGT